jgi:hypothetical protein
MPERRNQWLEVAIAWTMVGIPLEWGIWMTVKKALLLFQG